jgi:antitoxin component YwqK of YwqJK toxin-antitoxin module
MKAIRILVVLAAILAMAGCGKKVVEGKKVLDEKNTVERGELRYEANSKTPFTGVAVELYDNGQKASECVYRAGKREGKGVIWYENGQKMTEAEFRAGELEGKSVTWHENGQKKSEGEYRASRLVAGTHTEWDENGNVIEKR